jgi:hypothetical protein
VIVDLLAATEPDALDGAAAKSGRRRHEYTRRLAI